MVSEPSKPLLDTVILSPGTGAYVSQSDKGEIVMGAMLDLFPSYAQRGSFAVKQAIIAAVLALFPSFSRLQLLRQWAGIVDVGDRVRVHHLGTSLDAVVVKAPF